MKMYVRYFIIGFLSLVSSCVNEKEDAGMQPDAVEVGDMLPEFTVVMNDGRTVESGSLQGQPSFILFFNTACGDCRRELPLVQQMYERYGADGRMVFMAISREQDALAVGEYWADNGLTIPFRTDRPYGLPFVCLFVHTPHLCRGCVAGRSGGFYGLSFGDVGRLDVRDRTCIKGNQRYGKVSLRL